jgi:hypothetical protein
LRQLTHRQRDCGVVKAIMSCQPAEPQRSPAARREGVRLAGGPSPKSVATPLDPASFRRLRGEKVTTIARSQQLARRRSARATRRSYRRKDGDLTINVTGRAPRRCPSHSRRIRQVQRSRNSAFAAAISDCKWRSAPWRCGRHRPKPGQPRHRWGHRITSPLPAAARR